MNILVIDDERSVASLFQAVLGRKGHHVTIERDGEAGVQAFYKALETEPFDLVITDISLPIRNGNEVCKLIKEASPLTVVILTSGNPGNNESSACGADGYLQKPFGLDELETEINHCMGITAPPST